MNTCGANPRRCAHRLAHEPVDEFRRRQHGRFSAGDFFANIP
jgi:hypothetical protein